jgi:hypothetical protein
VAAVGPLEDPVRIVPILGERLALDREYGGAAGGDCGGRVILRRVDVAGGPAHLGAERLERLDEHRGLYRHVQGTGDARATQRLLRGELVADRDQARHFGFRNRDLLAAPVGEREVLDQEIGGFFDGCVHGSILQSP